jgi:hypothetical protein
MALVLILVVWGGVRLSFDCLRFLSMGAMRSRVDHRVEAVWVAWWSNYRYGGWAMVGLSWAAHRGENQCQARPGKKFRPTTN